MKYFSCLIITLNFFYSPPVVASAKEIQLITAELEWEEVPGAKAYEIEIQSEGFKKRFQNKNSIFSVQIPIGEHRVRGRSLDRRGVYGEWSEFTSFSAVPQTVNLKDSAEKFTPKIKLDKFQAIVSVKWNPIVGVKIYRFYLKDEKNNVIATHDSPTASVHFRTPPGTYQYNITAIYSGNVESAQSEFQPIIEVHGKQLDPPEIASTATEEQNKIFKVKKDKNPFSILTKVEYSPFLGEKLETLSIEKTSTSFVANKYHRPGRYRVSFRHTLRGYADSDPVIREFFVKPNEEDLNLSQNIIPTNK